MVGIGPLQNISKLNGAISLLGQYKLYKFSPLVSCKLLLMYFLCTLNARMSLV